MTKTVVKTCEYCGEEFDSAAKYASHKRFEHPGWRQGLVPLPTEANGTVETESLPNIYTCPHCQCGFTTRHSLAAHAHWCCQQETSPVGQSVEGQVEESAGADTGLCYCPGCGLGIGHLGRVLNEAGVSLDYCPQCGVDLLKVRQALEG